MKAQAAELDDETYTEIKQICATGDDLARRQQYKEAITTYSDAWLVGPSDFFLQGRQYIARDRSLMTAPSLISSLTTRIDESRRAHVALAAAREAARNLRSENDIQVARDAIRLASECANGGVPPSDLEDTLQNEYDEGLLINEQLAKDPVKKSAWLALASAIAYVAYLEYQKRRERPGPLISEVREDEVDRLTSHLALLPNVD